ncbi:MAG: helix-turn-helix transcriptional regulator [Firmicutes bacterium]|nr:helix-turn-helix transcriptional regulator [Bacillota bacterium]
MQSTEKKSPAKTIKRFGKYPFLFKMIFTIYFLICIPMILIQVFVLRSSYQKLNTQNDAYCVAETRNLSSRMSSQISAFRTTALKISNTNQTNIKRYLSPNAPDGTARLASEELSNYLLSVPMAKHIGIYYVDRQIFLNDEYYYLLENFCSSFSKGDPDVYERVYSLFTEPFEGRYRMISSMRSRSSVDAEIIVAFPVRMNQYSDDYDAIIYFTMTYSSMNTFLTTSLSESSTYAIFSQSGNLFFTNNSANIDELYSESFAGFLKDETQSKYQLAAGDADAYKYREENSSYTFVTVVGKNQFEENSFTFLRSMELLLLANLLVTLILAGITSYINYNPLRKLVSRISSHGKDSSSELDRIESAITELDNRASDQSIVIMDYVLNDLLYGTSVRQQQLTDLVPNFDCRNFCAVSVLCTRPTTEQSRRISELTLKSSGCQIYITDLPNKEYSLFVCLSKQEIDTEQLSRSITEAVREILQETCEVYVGTVVNSLDDIPLSYYASQARAGGQSGFVYSKDYPSAEIQLFSRQIEASNLSAARQTLQVIFEFALKNSHNRVLCRYVSYEVLIAYVSARKRTRFPITDAELKNLLAFTNAAHLQKELESSIAAMEQHLSQEHTDETTALQNEIVEYVNENFYKTDISLINVADHFGISIYMLSRVFKSRTGIGFKEYITAKRLELACRLLITTNDNISVIAQNSGFENPTYFASIFKAHYGMTPSKFRESAV